MVGNQQVFKTPNANVAVAMANLDRLPDTPEYQGVRTNIRAHLIAAMGQTTVLLKRDQAFSYMEVTSDQTHRSRASPRPGGHRHSRSPIDDHRKEAHSDDRGRDAGRNREQRRGHDQEVDQGRTRDLRQNLSHKDACERINRRINDRAAHENVHRIEYDAAHGPPSLKQFSSHLRQVVWPHNFKLEKLKKYDGKENPENWITLYEIAVWLATGDEHVMANYFLVVLDQAGHQWLLGLPENSFDSWEELPQALIDNFIATCEQPGNKYDLERIRDRKNEPLRDYIRRFSDMHLKIPKISHDEAISAFIKGLHFHEALRSKLLRKRPTTVAELLTTAKNYVDAEKLIREDVRGTEQPPRRDDSRGRFDNRNPRRSDNRDHREGWDRRHDNRGDFRGNRPQDNDHEVNTVKRSNGR